jgi:hypothetical protein
MASIAVLPCSLNQVDICAIIRPPTTIIINQEINYVKEQADDHAGPRTLALMLCVSCIEVQRRIQEYVVGSSKFNHTAPWNKL